MQCNMVRPNNVMVRTNVVLPGTETTSVAGYEPSPTH